MHVYIYMIYAYLHVCVYLHVYGAQRSHRALDCGEHTCHVEVRKQLLEICSLLQFRIQKYSSGPSSLCSKPLLPTEPPCQHDSLLSMAHSHVIQNSSNQEGVEYYLQHYSAAK